VTGRPAARTFKPRRRSLSAPRAAAFVAAMAERGLGVDGPVLSLPAVFAGDGPFVLDIGFGAGEALVAMAHQRPHECVVGVEVHTTGLATVLEAGLANVRVVDGDVLDFLPRLAPASLDEVRIWFPDPWPKQRQRHRRLVRPDVVGALAGRLRAGGRVHLATDDVDYSLQMQRACVSAGLVGGVIERPPWRPVTRFEQRALAEGRAPIDLLYTLKRNSVVSPSTNS
jgi:tRNA (guanine-N7-)-methyltransferase